MVPGHYIDGMKQGFPCIYFHGGQRNNGSQGRCCKPEESGCNQDDHGDCKGDKEQEANSNYISYFEKYYSLIV